MNIDDKQAKFKVGQQVRDSDGNSLSNVYEVLKVFWWKSTNTSYSSDCFKYVLANVENPDHIMTKKEHELKDAKELNPYEVYGNKMVGKEVSRVEFNHDQLCIVFDDNSYSKFTAYCCQNEGYLDFEGSGE